MNENLVITIGRQNGSGGRYVGEKLAEALGIKCYNKELITETAKEYGLNVNDIEKKDEKLPVNIFYFGGQLLPSKIFEEQANFMKKIASRESCVFIGRAADYVFKDYSNVVNVFINAPLGSRIERYSRRNNLSITKAEKEISEQDKKRANFYKFYTNQKWGEANNYNICIDTSKVGIDGAVKIIQEYIKINRQDDIIK